MPRPRSLTPQDIAGAALTVIDRDGLAALTIRAVATELRMSPMGLYRYITDRDDLERLIVEHVLGAVDITPPDRPTWTQQIETLVRRLRAAVAAHPGIVPLTLTHRHDTTGVLRWSEAILEILTRAGLSGTARVIALRSLLAYIIGAIQLEHLGPLSGPGTAAIAKRSDYPNLSHTAADAGSVGPDEEFNAGLAAVLAGLTTQVHTHQP